MVLAHGEHLDVSDQDQLVVPEVERGGEHVAGVLVQPGEDLGAGPGDAEGSVPQAVAIGVLADADEELADGGLDPGNVEPRAGSPVELPVDLPVELPVELAFERRMCGGAGRRARPFRRVRRLMRTGQRRLTGG
jgi:hypothetical protein